MIAVFVHATRAARAAVSVAVLLAAAGWGAAAPAAPWTVFMPADGGVPMGANLVANPGFESAPIAWTAYESGFTTDTTVCHGGGCSLKLVNAATTDSQGARQTVTLNQASTTPLYFSAWSRADAVAGDPGSGYSLYVDLQYMDNSWLYGQLLMFDTGTHDWQFREGFIRPAKPLKSARVYCLLRGALTGTAWFDDISLCEVNAGLATFDTVPVATVAPAPPPYGGASLALATSDGLALRLSAAGGVVSDIALGGSSVCDPSHVYAGGFFVRDVAGGSDWLHAGGEVTTQTGGALLQTASVPALGLALNASYTATADRIGIHAELTDTSGTERAVTLYFALPVLADGWLWGDDIRTGRTVAGASELGNLGSVWWQADLGATGYLSRYPWAALSGPSGGLALATPLNQPRIMRLVCNPQTRQLYAAFDLGISPLTSKFPGKAWADVVLYRFDAAWGFRAAAQGYYDRFPAFFTRRIPPSREGAWVAFSDLEPIPNLLDFGIGIHEVGGDSQITFDETVNIASLRYVSIPFAHWLPIDTTGVDPDDYDQAVAYLFQKYTEGDKEAEATLSSGVFDDADRFSYASGVHPWCSGVGGCALFRVNADPDIADTSYPLNKAHHDWSAAARNSYTVWPLEGEFVDCFSDDGNVLDFRTAHWAAADTPLTFRTSDKRAGLPILFSTIEFVRWLAADVHDNLGKWVMTNGAAVDTPWGADLPDVNGQEQDWLETGSFVPRSDTNLAYRRTLSYQRPYCLLMNTNFDNLTYELVERYFQVALFYGIYPSMFSANASSNRYWDNPALYNRDRPLFLRYLPVIKHINAAGWQPVTRAEVSAPSVYIERFGSWPGLHFTLRNMDAATVTVTVTVEADGLGLPSGQLAAVGLLSSQYALLEESGATRSFGVTLGSLATEVMELRMPAAVDDWWMYDEVAPDGETRVRVLPR